MFPAVSLALLKHLQVRTYRGTSARGALSPDRTAQQVRLDALSLFDRSGALLKFGLNPVLQWQGSLRKTTQLLESYTGQRTSHVP